MAGAATPTATRYCPYCGRFTDEPFSWEHVVRESIWRAEPPIEVCKPCNVRCGAEVDRLLRRHPLIAMIAHHYAGGKPPSHRDRIEAGAGPTADPSTQVSGFLDLHEVSNARFRLVLKPNSGEQHGVSWIDQKTADRSRHRPTPKVRVLDERSTAIVSFPVPTPQSLALERPFAKMLLGGLWQEFGDRIQDSPVLVTLRAVLWDAAWPARSDGTVVYLPVIPREWVCTWVDLPTPRTITPRPLHIDYCVDDPLTFEAVVTLFGTLCMKFRCPSFDRPLSRLHPRHPSGTARTLDEGSYPRT